MSERPRRLLDPFDAMRATRTLAPHDPKLNDLRWLAGEALRHLHARAHFDTLRSAPADRLPAAAPSAFLPLTDKTLAARDLLKACEAEAGAASWPIVVRIVLEGAGVRDCRALVPEIATPWRADAVVTDRLRLALDRFKPLLGLGALR